MAHRKEEEMDSRKAELFEKAQSALRILEETVVDLLRLHPHGLTNREVTTELGLESDQDGEQENYLSWSVLGRLMKAGNVLRKTVEQPGKKAKRSVYKLSE